MKPSILILGGTTEARELAGQIAAWPHVDATMSLAGRTRTPAAQSLPLRSGGFGGVDGLAGYLRDHRVNALIDATHPYAANMSAHATAAAQRTATPLLMLSRPAWVAVEGDHWIDACDSNAAAELLGSQPRRVFLAVGRQQLAAFVRAPQHFYLIRSIEQVDATVSLPRAQYLLERGPFDVQAERATLIEHAIEMMVSKNSGGDATYAKIAAARALGIPIVMIARPPPPAIACVDTVDAALAWLHHLFGAPTARGV
jgi:precorrin-6A/cobalt-precorrin-6A reductase